MAEKTSKVTHQQTMGQKLRKETSASRSRKAKLRYDKKNNRENPSEVKKALAKKKQVVKKEMLRTMQTAAISAKVHQSIRENSDDNVGITAVNQSSEYAEGLYYSTKYTMYGHKIKKIKKQERQVQKAENVKAQVVEEAEGKAKNASKAFQKRKIKRDYAKAKHEASKKGASVAGKAGKKVAEETKDVMSAAMEFMINLVKEHPQVFLIIGICALIMVMMSALLTSCSMMGGGSSNTMVATSFTAEDQDIVIVDAAYIDLETALQTQVNYIRSDYPGYDEYNFSLAEIGHDPYELAAYLTVLYENYTPSQVQGMLSTIFDAQYELTVQRVVEVRYREEERTGYRTIHNPDGTTSTERYTYTVTVSYNYYILNTTLTNIGIDTVVNAAGLTADQRERYAILLETQGNKSYLFGDSIYTNPTNPPGEYLDYDIPGEALTDATFAAMIQEAERYLGYPYVWGGSSPSTSFDCSGFVSWVINHSGWSVGRQTANGLFNLTSHISPSDAKPGDLIFFQGTYAAAGSRASHVGIYVGNGMMIHCGNPISYASVNTSYWQEHFYCYGRLP